MAVFCKTSFKNTSFELEESNQYYFKIIISTSRTCNLFEFLVSVINHYHSNELHLL